MDKRKIVKLSDIEAEKVAGGVSTGGGFGVACNDCTFSAHYDANSYEAAFAAASAHEQESGHIVFVYYED